MKKQIRLFALAAIALTGLWSCAKSELEAPRQEGAEITIEATLADAATKTSVTEEGQV